MELTLSVHDKVRLYTKSYLSMHHEQIITLLYQPIIGFKATSLYRTLWSFVNIEKSELTLSHRQLLTFFDFELNELIKVREQLEAIDLLHVYYNTKEGYYLYELRQPLTSKQFFLDSNLNVHLLYKVGHNLYEYLENKFVVKNHTKNLKNITKSFDEVYPNLEVVANMDDEKEYVNQHMSQFSAPIHYDFDYELFIALLNKSFVTTDCLDDKVKQRVLNEAALYHFDAQMMSKVVLECVNDAGEIDLDVLHETAKRKYKRLKTKPDRSKQMKASMTEKEFHDKKDIDKLKRQALFNYKTKTPHEWLKILQNHTEVPNSYLEVVKMLLDDYHLTSEVINVLIEFVRNRNDGRLPMEYSKAIASSWSFKKIKTAEQAIKEIEKIEQIEESYVKKGKIAPTFTVKKARFVASTPEWLEQHEEYRQSVKEEKEEVDINALEDLLASFK